jgi:PBP1b-binding outer membrane lipoprotein LpoB
MKNYVLVLISIFILFGCSKAKRENEKQILEIDNRISDIEQRVDSGFFQNQPLENIAKHIEEIQTFQNDILKLQQKMGNDYVEHKLTTKVYNKQYETVGKQFDKLQRNVDELMLTYRHKLDLIRALY